MSPAEHDTAQARAFVDALRGWLGLGPLYAADETKMTQMEFVGIMFRDKWTQQTPKKGAPK